MVMCIQFAVSATLVQLATANDRQKHSHLLAGVHSSLENTETSGGKKSMPAWQHN
jgi:hypothetical protein